jgi:hypothetical protein
VRHSIGTEGLGQVAKHDAQVDANRPQRLGIFLREEVPTRSLPSWPACSTAAETTARAPPVNHSNISRTPSLLRRSGALLA